MKNSSAPWWPCLFTNQHGVKEFDRGSPKKHSCEIILKSGQRFILRFFKFSIYRNKVKNSPVPWRPCFFTNQHGVKEFDIWSPKKHSCEIILKSGQLFILRRFLKFFLSVAMATRVLHGNSFLEGIWKRTTQGTFL